MIIFLMSTVKFVFGAVPTALGFGFSFFEAVTVTCLGGFTGVTMFVFMSDRIVEAIRKRREERIQRGEPHGRKFTRRNKVIVKAKMRFGLIGIAFLTPLLFSIPLGCFLAVRYFKNKRKIIAYMYLSVIFWSVSISSLKLLFHVNVGL